MVAIVTRAGKGSPLTNAEVDANFVNLNNGKLETASNLSDLADASAARTNLGLGSLSTLNSITSLMVTDALGFTPANKAGDTFSGNVVVNASVGIGTSTLTGYGLHNSKPLTGAATSFGTVSSGVAQSDVTTAANYFASYGSLQNTAFTLSNLRHFNADAAASFGSATVATQVGFSVTGNLIGATNNYGFRGQIPSGTGRWNAFMDGTAQNYFAGNLLIGSSGLANGKVVIGGNLTGQALMSALRAEMTIMSDVTTGARGYQTLFGTEAASWTLPDIIHYRAVQGTFGAGSTVTSQNAFVADASLIGAGTNIGFRGAIPSGSNRWNLYMDGTAQNYLGGATILNAALGVGAAGSPSYGTAGQVLTSAGPGAVPTWSSPTGGVTSFNTRTGAVTLSSGDVTGALGYTPYNSTNPSGYITSSSNIGRITTGGIDYGSYGSIGVSGTTSGYAGVSFSGVSGTLMMSSGASGFYYSNSTWRVYWDASGNQINTGNVTAYSSDMRLKKNQRRIEDPLSILRAISGVYFDWDVEECAKWNFHPPEHDAGLLAQQVQAVYPYAVFPAPFDRDPLNSSGSRSGKNYLTVQYEKVVPVLVEAIKVLEERIDQLTHKE